MPRLTRFCIGFALAYWTLVWLPWCLGPFAGVSYGWWFDVGQWTITAIFRLPPRYGASMQSGNVLTPYASTAAFVAVSTAVAAIWMSVDGRGATHRAAAPWVFGAMRLTLATFMLGYGWVKVLPAQFGLMAHGAGTDFLMQQLGQLPPRDLMWAFMEASRFYQVATGLVELAGGLLLLSRRTTTWGALLSAAAMANVLLLNIAYDVTMKFLAGQILLLALAVAAPYLRGMAAALARNTEEQAPGPALPRALGRWPGAAQAAGLIVACLVMGWTYRVAAGIVVSFAQAPARTPLHGIWDVESMTRDGVEVPLVITDQNLWRRLVMPFGGTDSGAMLVWMSDAVTRCRSRIDTREKTLTIEPVAETTVAGSVRLPPPAPTRMSFRYTTESGGALLLETVDPNAPVVRIRLKRFDHARYQLLAHDRGWRW